MTDTPAVVGPFTLLGPLGADRTGTVHTATVHTATDPEGRLAAVTVLTSDAAADPAARARFAHRVETARRLRGPWIVPVLAADPGATRPWLATAFVAGPSLAQAVRTSGPLPPAAALALARALAVALASAHRGGTVHGELRPERVLLGPDGPWLLGPVGDPDPEDAAAGFAAPEQADGQPAGPASDVYGLAALVVLAGTGHPPSDDSDLGELAEPLRSVLAACLAPSPAARPVADALLPRLPGPDPGPGWLATTTAPGPGVPTASVAGGGAAAPRYPDPPSGSAVATRGPRTSGPTGARRIPRRAVIGGAAAVLVAGGIGVGVWAAVRGSGPPAPTQLWQRRNRIALGLPLAVGSGSVLLVDSVNTMLRGHDPRTGEARWTADVGRVGPDPLVTGDGVVVPDVSPLTCVDSGSGRTRWRDENPLRLSRPIGAAGPILVVTTQTVLPRAASSYELSGLRVTDGSVAWSVPLPGPGTSQDRFAVAGDGRLHAVLDQTVVTVEAGSGQVLWRQQSTQRASDVLLCTRILIVVSAGNDVLAGTDPATGTLLWTRTLRGAGGTRPVQVSTDGTRLVQVRGDALVGLDPRTGADLWTTPPADGPARRIVGRPLVFGGLVLALAAADPTPLSGLTLLAFGADDGTSRWSVRVGDETAPPPNGERLLDLAGVGDVVVVSSLGSVYAYGPVQG